MHCAGLEEPWSLAGSLESALLQWELQRVISPGGICSDVWVLAVWGALQDLKAVVKDQETREDLEALDLWGCLCWAGG